MFLGESLKLGDFFHSIPSDILADIQTMSLKVESERCFESADEALGKTVLLGGKRLRPLLTHLFGRFLGLSLEDVRPLARSIEMVHAASLAHDDVIDQAETRRGVKSINREASNKKAILAGDYLLANVIVELTQTKNLDLVQEMAEVIHQLAVGEWLQLDASEDRSYSKDIILKVARLKTSSVMSWCFVAPALLKELPDQVINQARVLGDNLGLAFQFIDDTLDYSKNSDKDQLLDLENNIVNSVVYAWFEKNPKMYSLFKGGRDLKDLIHTPEHLAELKDCGEMIRLDAHERLGTCRQTLDDIAANVEALNLLNHEGKPLEIKKDGLSFIFDYLEKRMH